MRRKTKNSIVNKAITIAMSCMMIMSTPAMQVHAAENELGEAATAESETTDSEATTSESTDSETSEGEYDVSSVEIKADDETVADIVKDKTDSLTDSELVKDLQDSLENLDMTQDAQDIIDDVKDIVQDAATDVTDDFANGADDAINDVKDIASDAVASDAVGALEETKENLKNDTDTLLNNDKETEAVKADPIVDTITSEGDIQINVTDESGNDTTQSLGDYVSDKKDIVTDAANEAAKLAESLPVNPSDEELNKAKEDLSNLKDKAQDACDAAQTAVDSAEAVLNSEIADYNTYAQMCGFPQLDGTASDETQNILQQQIDAVTAQLKDSDSKIIEALSKIEAAKQLLDNSKAVAEQAQTAVESIEVTEKNLTENAEGFLKNTESALNTKNDDFDYYKATEIILALSKDALEQNIEEINKKEESGEITEFESELRETLKAAVDKCQCGLDDLNRDDEDDYFQTFKDVYTSVQHIYDSYYAEEEGQKLPSYHDRFVYAISTSKDLAKLVNDDIQAKKDNVEAAQKAYEEALNEYKKLREEYADTTDALQYLKPLQDKLNAAAKNLADAREDLKTAEVTLNVLNDIEIIPTYDPKDPGVDPIDPDVDPVDPDVDPIVPDVDPIDPVVDPTPDEPSVDPVSPQTPAADTSSESETSSESKTSSDSDNSALPMSASNYIVEDVPALSSSMTSIADENIPLTDTVQTPASDIVLTDEAVPLADTIPETGDNTRSALPVALAGIAAIAGALYLNLRKRI